MEFGKLLRQSNYDRGKSEFLLEDFTNGFDLGYRGPDIGAPLTDSTHQQIFPFASVVKLKCGTRL